MPSRDEQQHEMQKDVPPVGRPRGAVWRSLQADGVVWEGQVLLVGEEVDLAARMIITHRRVVFVRGGELALEMPRGWLRPEPVLRRDGVLDLFVTMPDANLFDEPLRVPIRMREGHAAAGHVIAMLAPNGVRRISPDALSGIERAREATTPPRFGGFWDDIESDLHRPGNGLVGAVDDFDQYQEHPDSEDVHSRLAPLEPPDRVVRAPSTSQRRQQASTFPITGMLPRDQRRSPWKSLIRLVALTVLLGTAAALGAGRLDVRVPGSTNEPILVAPTATISVTSPPSEAPNTALSPDQQSAVAIGVGGAAGQISPEDQTAAVAVATESPETPAPVVAMATTAPVVEPAEPVIPTPAATTQTEPNPTAAPQPSPTVASVSTTSPAPDTETETPTEVVATATQDSVTQVAAVSVDQPPAQEIVVGPLRLAFTTALRAESLPRYALPPGSGEWVLLVAEITNDSDVAASLAMSDLRLFDRGTGTIVDLDTGTDVIATLAGFDPAWSNDSVITIEPSATAETLLLYLLPPGGSDDLALIVDQASVDLAPMLERGEASPAGSPELVAATVTEILDGSRITVDVAGLQETVKYLGFEAPISGDCFSTEATTANAELVQGQQIWLERQATDRDADDTLLRDVWISTQNGDKALVSARLLEAGAGTPMLTAPDTRYQAWLESSAALARSNGAGLWSACESAPASVDVASNQASRVAFMGSTWRSRTNFRH